MLQRGCNEENSLKTSEAQSVFQVLLPRLYSKKEFGNFIWTKQAQNCLGG